jgi:hypothetical protein
MPKSAYEDPVVAEVHAIRAKMLADCGGDHEKLMQLVRDRQKASSRKILSAPTSPPAANMPPVDQSHYSS